MNQNAIAVPGCSTSHVMRTNAAGGSCLAQRHVAEALHDTTRRLCSEVTIETKGRYRQVRRAVVDAHLRRKHIPTCSAASLMLLSTVRPDLRR